MTAWNIVARMTEHVWSLPTVSGAAAIAAADADRLTVERARVAPAVADLTAVPTYSIRNRFRYWEQLQYNMENAWPRDGFYLIEEYINDLDNRDSIAAAIQDDIPGGSELHDALNGLLGRLDERFRRLTFDDGGHMLLTVGKNVPIGAVDRWWWSRCPVTAPWEV